MFNKLLKPFFYLIKWHLNFFDVLKLRREIAETYNIQFDPALEHLTEKALTLWKWIGIFYSSSSYILIPVMLYLKYYSPSCPDVILQLIGNHLFLYGAYMICTVMQYLSMKDDIKEYKKLHEENKDSLQ